MAVKIQTTSYVIFSNLKLVVGTFGGEVTQPKSLSVTWSIGQTTVTGARLVVNAGSDQWLPTGIKVNFDGQDVLTGSDGDVSGGKTVSTSIDISSLLQNGVNTISATAYASLHGATVTITITLEVDFQGTPPSTQPTIGGIPLGTALIVGGGALFIIILVIVVGGRRK